MKTPKELIKSSQIEKIEGKPYTHILNSNGIIRFNASQFDMVRLGIGLYGVCSNPETQNKLLPASTLKSKISQMFYTYQPTIRHKEKLPEQL